MCASNCLLHVCFFLAEGGGFTGLHMCNVEKLAGNIDLNACLINCSTS